MGWRWRVEWRFGMQNSSSSSSARREGDRDVAMDISKSCRVLSCVGEINCELLGGGGGNVALSQLHSYFKPET